MTVTDKSLPASRLGISEEEWKLRCDLAACYQLTDLYGMYDLPGTHISARVPGHEDHFLLNPYGLFFDEITASSLMKVDMHGKIVWGSGKLNPAGFTVHSAVHMARPDIVCAMHTHTRAIIGVGGQKDGLLPLTQKALMLQPFLAYYDFEGSPLELNERERIARSLGDRTRCIILRNHGALTLGASIAEAFSWMYKLETACQYQIDMFAGNRQLVSLSEGTVAPTAAQGLQVWSPGGYAEPGNEWPALVRKLERDRGTSYLD